MGLRSFLVARVPEGIRNRVRSSAVVRRLARAAFWSTVGAASARLFGLCAGLVLARVVGKIEFGKYGLIQTTIGMCAVVVGLGIKSVATKFLAELRQSDPARAGRILTLTLVSTMALGGATGAALYFLAPWLAGEVFSEEGLVSLIRLGAVVLVGNTLVGIQVAALTGLEAFRSIARLSVIQGGLTFLGSAGGALAGGVEGALWGLACAAGVTVLLTCVVLRSAAGPYGIRFPERGWWAERRLLLSFGLPGMLATLLVAPVVWYGQAVLAGQDRGFEELAEFAVAWRWRGLVAFVPSLVCAGYLPVLSSLRGASPGRRLSLMWKTSAVSISSATSLALVFCLTSTWILWAYGADFVQGRLVLVILMGQAVAESLNTVMRQSLTAMNRVWTRVFTNVFWAGTCLACIILLVPTYGSVGLAVSIVTAQVAHLALQVPLAIRSMKKPGAE